MVLRPRSSLPRFAPARLQRLLPPRRGRRLDALGRLGGGESRGAAGGGKQSVTFFIFILNVFFFCGDLLWCLF